MRKLGIYYFLGIGDWILLTPALVQVKKRSPSTKIFVVTNRLLAPLLKNDKNIEGYSFLPDYSVFTENFREDDFITAPNYTSIRPWESCKRHVVNIYARILGVDSCVGFPVIRLQKKDDAFGRAFSEKFKKRVIVLYADSSYPVKRWDEKRWEEVVRKIKGYLFVQVGDKSHTSIKGAINMLGRTSLTEAFAIVKHARLLVGVDGVFSHVAKAFDVPRVILWGPNHPQFIGYNTDSTNIFKKIRCNPCWSSDFYLLPEICQSRCLNKKPCKCMSIIEASEVADAVEKMLGGYRDAMPQGVVPALEGERACVSCRLRNKCLPDFFKVRFRDLLLLRDL